MVRPCPRRDDGDRGGTDRRHLIRLVRGDCRLHHRRQRRIRPVVHSRRHAGRHYRRRPHGVILWGCGVLRRGHKRSDRIKLLIFPRILLARLRALNAITIPPKLITQSDWDRAHPALRLLGIAPEIHQDANGDTLLIPEPDERALAFLADAVAGAVAPDADEYEAWRVAATKWESRRRIE